MHRNHCFSLACPLWGNNDILLPTFASKLLRQNEKLHGQPSSFLPQAVVHDFWWFFFLSIFLIPICEIQLLYSAL